LKLPPVAPSVGAAGKNSTEYFVCQLSPGFLIPIREPKTYMPAFVTALIYKWLIVNYSLAIWVIAYSRLIEATLLHFRFFDPAAIRWEWLTINDKSRLILSTASPNSIWNRMTHQVWVILYDSNVTRHLPWNTVAWKNPLACFIGNDFRQLILFGSDTLNIIMSHTQWVIHWLIMVNTCILCLLVQPVLVVSRIRQVNKFHFYKPRENDNIDLHPAIESSPAYQISSRLILNFRTFNLEHV